MGVIIGSLMDDSALCVEAPESPDIKISEPSNVELKSMGAVCPDVGYGFIGPARSVSVTRIFTLRKKDIAAVTNWIASLSGSSLEYNAGSDGDKIIAGDFRLDGEITFKSNSPTLCTATATFIGQVLDCNFLLPSGLEFRNLSATESAIFIGNVERTRWTTKDKGDESGIVFKAGRALFWDEVPEPDRNGLLLDEAGEISPDGDIPHAHFIFTAAYREIHMTVNGYIIKTWYIPTKIRQRIMGIKPTPIWYGITEDEFLANGPPVFDDLLDLSDSTNPRLYGGATQYKGGSQDPAIQWKQMPIPKPDGQIYQWYGYSQLVNGNTWSPNRSIVLRWDEQLYGKRPYNHTRMYLVGRVWQFIKSYSWRPSYSDDEMTVSLGWARTDEGIFLTAIGSNGQIITLLEYAL